MTDDLVKRLLCYADIDDAVYHPWVYGEAADRIQALEAALRPFADLAHYYDPNDGDDNYEIWMVDHSKMPKIGWLRKARTALAGEKKDD